MVIGDASAPDLSIFDPVSPPAESIHHLSILVLAITGGIFLAVEGVLIYSLFRFRRPYAPGSSEPPQVYGSKPIEIAWTAAPALIVFVLTLVIARTEWEVRPSTHLSYGNRYHRMVPLLFDVLTFRLQVRF
jgi:cytochrome c oxidase subunit 2